MRDTGNDTNSVFGDKQNIYIYCISINNTCNVSIVQYRYARKTPWIYKEITFKKHKTDEI